MLHLFCMKKIFIFLGILIFLGVGCQDYRQTQSQVVVDEHYPLSHKLEKTMVNTPTSGPYVHTVRSASSTDGLVWSDDRIEDLVLHASVPTAIQKDDNTIIVYFVDALNHSGGLSCIVSENEVFDWGTCVIQNMTTDNPADFSIIQLADGRYRMYYYAAQGNPDTLDDHNVDCAISDDGFMFIQETTVFTYPGLVDPDIFWTGQQWVLHSYSITDKATVVATSSDGINFTYQGELKPTGYGVTKPIMLDTGSLRMYGFNQDDGQDTFYSFISQDGLSWTKEDGVRLSAPEGYSITDPFVIPLNNGGYQMFYKQTSIMK